MRKAAEANNKDMVIGGSPEEARAAAEGVPAEEAVPEEQIAETIAADTAAAAGTSPTPAPGLWGL